MGGNVVLQYLLAVVFAALTLYYLYRLVTAATAVARTGHAARIAMCAAMLLMLRPWNADVPAQLGVPVFLAAALWFAYLALFRPDAASDAGCHPWFDAAKMIAMAWMYVAMSPAATQPATDAAAMAMPDMPGMGSDSAAMTMSVPLWSVCVSSVAAALLLAGALWLVRRPVLGGGSPGVDQATTAAMAAAMAGSLLLLV